MVALLTLCSLGVAPVALDWLETITHMAHVHLCFFIQPFLDIAFIYRCKFFWVPRRTGVKSTVTQGAHEFLSVETLLKVLAEPGALPG